MYNPLVTPCGTVVAVWPVGVSGREDGVPILQVPCTLSWRWWWSITRSQWHCRWVAFKAAQSNILGPFCSAGSTVHQWGVVNFNAYKWNKCVVETDALYVHVWVFQIHDSMSTECIHVNYVCLCVCCTCNILYCIALYNIFTYSSLMEMYSIIICIHTCVSVYINICA